VRFQVLKASSINMIAFWNIAPCSPVEVDRRFRGAYCLHHQDNDTLLQRNYTALYSRRLPSSFQVLLWTSTVTRLRDAMTGARFTAEARDFRLVPRPDQMLPTKPPIQSVWRALSLGVRWTEREANHSPPSNTEVKNYFNNTPTPL
jgi:hypothetical protein